MNIPDVKELKKHYTDILTVEIKVDETTPGNVLKAFIMKTEELLEHLKECEECLPALPSGGAGNNDAGSLNYKITHLY